MRAQSNSDEHAHADSQDPELAGGPIDTLSVADRARMSDTDRNRLGRGLSGHAPLVFEMLP